MSFELDVLGGAESLMVMESMNITYTPPPVDPVDDDTDDDTTDDDTSDDDTGPFGNIPGFGTGLMVVSMIGATALIIFKKRK